LVSARTCEEKHLPNPNCKKQSAVAQPNCKNRKRIKNKNKISSLRLHSFCLMGVVIEANSEKIKKKLKLSIK